VELGSIGSWAGGRTKVILATGRVFTSVTEADMIKT
jgi:hypothetical protein